VEVMKSIPTGDEGCQGGTCWTSLAFPASGIAEQKKNGGLYLVKRSLIRIMSIIVPEEFQKNPRWNRKKTKGTMLWISPVILSKVIKNSGKQNE